MLPVFMNFAANGKILFYARCGAREFFDTLRRPEMIFPGGALFDKTALRKKDQDSRLTPDWAILSLTSA